MDLTIGSVVNMAPAPPGWLVMCTSGDETWREPIVGWATVVKWKAGDEFDPNTDDGRVETGLEPVVLIEGCFLVTMSDYRENTAPKGATVFLAYDPTNPAGDGR